VSGQVIAGWGRCNIQSSSVQTYSFSSTTSSRPSDDANDAFDKVIDVGEGCEWWCR